MQLDWATQSSCRLIVGLAKNWFRLTSSLHDVGRCSLGRKRLEIGRCDCNSNLRPRTKSPPPPAWGNWDSKANGRMTVSEFARYSASTSYSGESETAFARALSILGAAGFTVQQQDRDSIEFTGPGLNSSRESAILGATNIRIRLDHDSMQLDAELGGVAKMRRFLNTFIPSLAVLLVVIIGPFTGWVAGMQNGLGFGVPGLPGLKWLMFTVPITLLPFLPWIVATPWVTGKIRTRTINAIDGLLQNITAGSR